MGLLHVFTLHFHQAATTPDISSCQFCPTGDLQCALRWLESFGDKSSWVEKERLSTHCQERLSGSSRECGLVCTVSIKMLYSLIDTFS